MKDPMMLDNLKGMASLAGVMKDLPRIKAQLEEVKAQLARIEVSADTGGGAVVATANGQLRIVSVHVESALISGLVDPERGDDRRMGFALIRRRASNDSFHACHLGRDNTHVCRRDHRVLATGDIATNTVDRDILVTQHDAGQCLDFNVAQ